MRAPSSPQLVAFLPVLAACANAFAADAKFVYVEVMSGGKVCLVQKHEGSCDAVVERVSRARKELPGAGITVSPNGCGEAAMAEAQMVAERLKKAGFKGVFTIGFLSEPNSRCAS
jgi:hypothetical protein